MDTPEARRLCYESGGIFVDGECLTPAQAKLRADQLQCALDGGDWNGTTCLPSIEAEDCTESTNDLTSGQLAITYGKLPPGTKYVAVEYKPEGKRKRTYNKIKPTFEPPLIISGQDPGTKITCTVKAVNEWGRQVGYSNEVTLVTKS